MCKSKLKKKNYQIDLKWHSHDSSNNLLGYIYIYIYTYILKDSITEFYAQRYIDIQRQNRCK